MTLFSLLHKLREKKLRIKSDLRDLASTLASSGERNMTNSSSIICYLLVNHFDKIYKNFTHYLSLISYRSCMSGVLPAASLQVKVDESTENSYVNSP